jgi:hypothetical protein
MQDIDFFIITICFKDIDQFVLFYASTGLDSFKFDVSTTLFSTALLMMLPASSLSGHSMLYVLSESIQFVGRIGIFNRIAYIEI